MINDDDNTMRKIIRCETAGRNSIHSFDRSFNHSAEKGHLDGDEGRSVEDRQRHRKAIDGGAEQLQDLADALPQRQPRRTVGQVQRHLADRAKVATTGQKDERRG